MVAVITKQRRSSGGIATTVCRVGLWLACLLALTACDSFLKSGGKKDDQPPEVIERTIEPEPEPVEPSPEPKPQPPPKPAPRYVLQGHLSLTADNDNILSGNSLHNAVVYFVPDSKIPAVRPQKFTIATDNKLFTPGLLVIPVGSEVAFPNNDNILHNVFSVSSGARFDLGFYGNGESRSYTFTQPGRVLVNCSVHNSMSADILVLDTPYYSRLDDSGEFSLENLPAGQGRLFLWHPQAREESHSLTVPADEPLSFELKLTKPRLPIANE